MRNLNSDELQHVYGGNKPRHDHKSRSYSRSYSKSKSMSKSKSRSYSHSYCK